MATHNYSFWFMPKGPIAKKYSQVIAQLAKQYASPIFPPHVTLIGSIEAQEEEAIGRTQELASLIQPFPIRLTTLAYTDAYYRALFVKVDPSPAILSTYQHARRLFPGKQETEFMPHLSLLYGNFPPETKEKIIEELGDSFAGEFEADTLHLYLTEGAVETWQSIKTSPLQR
jgi:2'-5' RNA ligase